MIDFHNVFVPNKFNLNDLYYGYAGSFDPHFLKHGTADIDNIHLLHVMTLHFY